MSKLNKSIEEKREKADFTGFVKFDDEKFRYELLDPLFLHGIAEVLTFGAKKYNDRRLVKPEDKI